MRWMPLAAVLTIGCGTPEGIVTDEQAPSPPPPVAIPVGTQVIGQWQFKNLCPDTIWVQLYNQHREDAWLVGENITPGMVVYLEARCLVGDEMCFAARNGDRMVARDCGPCAPGVQPTRRLACE